MTRTLAHPRPASYVDVQHLVLEDATWAQYEKLLRDIGDGPLRVTYDQGRMEIMSPLPEHERPKRLIGRMIETLTLELAVPMVSFGSTTFRRKEKSKGLEPDECYYFKHEARMRDVRRLELKKDPAPELVVEIDVTSRSVPRQPIYAALGVPEIWRFDGRRLQCLHLLGGKYHSRKMSMAFPFLEPARLHQFIDLLPTQDETTIILAFMKWVREQGWNV